MLSHHLSLPPLISGHNVHHSSEEFNFFTALRQGILFGYLVPIFYLPFAFFFPVKLFAAHKGINTLYQFWIHTKLIGKLPAPIEYIFVDSYLNLKMAHCQNTPSHHRAHHGRNPQYIDKNFGGTLIIFDR